MGQFRSALCDAIRVPGGSAVCPHFSPGRYAYDEIQAVFEHLRDFPQAFSGTDCAIVTPPSSVCAWGSVGGKRGGGIPSPPGPPCRAPGMAPLPGGTNAAAPGRRGDFPVPPLSGCAWGSVAGKRGGGIPSPPRSPLSGAWKGAPSQAAGMATLLRAWNGDAPGRRGDFPVPLLSGCAWGSVAGKCGGGTPSSPGPSPCRAPGKAPPPRRHECRRSFAPGMAMLRAGGGTFLSPLFLVVLGLRLAGSVEGGFRRPSVLPVGRLERRPSQAARMPPLRAWNGDAPGRRGDFPVPPLSACAWASVGGKRGGGDSVAPRYSLSGAWKGAPPRRQECRRSFVPGMATLLGGKNAAAPRRSSALLGAPRRCGGLFGGGEDRDRGAASQGRFCGGEGLGQEKQSEIDGLPPKEAQGPGLLRLPQ